jgi:hypothetical protein
LIVPNTSATLTELRTMRAVSALVGVVNLDLSTTSPPRNVAC